LFLLKPKIDCNIDKFPLPLNACNIALKVIRHLCQCVTASKPRRCAESVFFPPFSLGQWGAIVRRLPGYATGHHITQCRLDMSAQLKL